MALLSTLVAGAVASIPVATLGVLNLISGPDASGRAERKTSRSPQRTQLMERSQPSKATMIQSDGHHTTMSTAAAHPPTTHPKAGGPSGFTSVLDDPTLFPVVNSADTEAEDLFRDPYTQQLYLCTEDEMPLPDSDTSFHISEQDNQRKRALMNGLVGNEHIQRRPETTDFKNALSDEPSAAILRSMNPARNANLNQAFSRVSHFKHDDARPEGTGLIARGEMFGGNKIGYNWDDVWALRRNIVNQFNIRRGPNAVDPTVHLTHTTQTDSKHNGTRPSNMDVGQLRKRRGTIDNMSIADRSNTLPSRQSLLEKSERAGHGRRRRDASRDIANHKKASSTLLQRSTRENTRVALGARRRSGQSLSSRANAHDTKTFRRALREDTTLALKTRNRTRAGRQTLPSASMVRKAGDGAARPVHNRLRRPDGRLVGARDRGTVVRSRNQRSDNVRPRVRDDSGKGAVPHKHKRRFFRNANLPQRHADQTSGILKHGGLRMKTSQRELFNLGGEPVAQRAAIPAQASKEWAHRRKNRGRGSVHGKAGRAVLPTPKVNYELRGRATGLNRNGQRSSVRQQQFSSNLRRGAIAHERVNRKAGFATGHAATNHATVTRVNGQEVSARPGNGLLPKRSANAHPQGRQSLRARATVRRTPVPKSFPAHKAPAAALSRAGGRQELQHGSSTSQPTQHGRLEFED